MLRRLTLCVCTHFHEAHVVFYIYLKGRPIAIEEYSATGGPSPSAPHSQGRAGQCQEAGVPCGADSDGTCAVTASQGRGQDAEFESSSWGSDRLSYMGCTRARQ